MLIVNNNNNNNVKIPIGIEISAILSQNIKVYVGTESAINNFQKKLENLNVECRFAKTLYGFHSSFLHPIINEFKNKAYNILNESKNECITSKNFIKKNIISNVNGKYLLSNNFDVKYLCEHMIKPVRLDLSIETLLSNSDINHIIEIGPPGMLENLIALKTDSIKVIHSMQTR